MHNEIAEKINKIIPGASLVVHQKTIGDSSLEVEAQKILEVCKALKSDGFNVCQCITATDYPEKIELTYVLADFTKNLELLLKTSLPRVKAEINSVVSVWSSANFLERECFDMMGVKFLGHPDLRRILTSDDWEGYPLRKDYVVQEKYRDMVVNPPGKINTNDHIFGKKLKEEIGDPKKVSASWKDASAGDDAEEIKDGE